MLGWGGLVYVCQLMVDYTRQVRWAAGLTLAKAQIS